VGIVLHHVVGAYDLYNLSELLLTRSIAIFISLALSDQVLHYNHGTALLPETLLHVLSSVYPKRIEAMA
jgi:hypothetical protein